MRSIEYRVGGWPAEQATLHVAQDTRDLAYVGAWLDERSAEYLGIDSETNALDPWQPDFRCRLVQVADPHESFVVPIALDPWLTAGLIYRHPKWVAHYAEADERFLCRGLPMEPVRWSDIEPHFSDTQAVLAVYDPRTVTTLNPKDRIHPRIPRRKGLKETTTRLLTPTLAAAEDALVARFREMARDAPGVRANMSLRDLKGWGFARIAIDDPAYLLYSALDPLCTIRLFHLMREQLTARGKWPRTLAAMAEQWVVDGATYRGMDTDAPYVRWLDGQLAAVIEDHTPLLARHEIKVSGQGPNVGLAFKRLGVPESPKTDRDGKESWDKDALKMLLATCESAFTDTRYAGIGVPEEVVAVRELANAVLDVRKAGKYRSNWVAPMLWTIEHGDGAMHPSVRATGTVTTRMSCQKTTTAGPMHSAPKKDTRLRAAVRAPRGWVFVTADFSQAEPWVMAALSGDPDYLRDLLAGDINGVLATQVYGEIYDPAQGKAEDTEHYSMRQACKFAWLAWCYGAGDRKVDLLLGVHTNVVEQWRARYPVFAAYRDAMNARTSVSLDSGHEVPLWDRFYVDDTGQLQLRTDYSGNPIPSRLGLNGVTQGTQADILKVSIHRLLHWGWSWALRFFVHDEIVACVPEWMADTFEQVLTEAMTVIYRGVRIGCEVERPGRTWKRQPEAFSMSDLPELDDEAA